ncbi:microsomal signal peptidase 25 kDa subunit-domain-containing protein [Amanita rubescens]|nr:microsomal signal peptidase 25 kDa subunit-domain-containing protein [Amanita rubescens]
MARTPKKSPAVINTNDKRNGHGGKAESSPVGASDERPVGPLSVVVPPEERETVKVNNASLTELKNACDDSLKRFLSRPELFKQIHLHTDVRLALGWLSVLVAAGTALYGYKFDFEKSKPVVWVGVIIYVLLTTLQTVYAHFVEKETVFVGKRKTFSKRIITERLTIDARTIPAKRATSPSSESTPPAYSLTLTYHRSTSGGKSLLARGKTRGSTSYTEFFDDKGGMHQEKFEKWVGELVENAMEGKSS